MRTDASPAILMTAVFAVACASSSGDRRGREPAADGPAPSDSPDRVAPPSLLGRSPSGKQLEGCASTWKPISGTKRPGDHRFCSSFRSSGLVEDASATVSSVDGAVYAIRLQKFFASQSETREAYGDAVTELGERCSISDRGPKRELYDCGNYRVDIWWRGQYEGGQVSIVYTDRHDLYVGEQR